MRANIALTSLLLGALLISGCATMYPQFIARVDSIGAATADKNSYILLPGNKDTKAEDLQFKEYAAYVNRALIKQGFMPFFSRLVKTGSSENIFLIAGRGLAAP